MGRCGEVWRGGELKCYRHTCRLTEPQTKRVLEELSLLKTNLLKFLETLEFLFLKINRQLKKNVYNIKRFNNLLIVKYNFSEGIEKWSFFLLSRTFFKYIYLSLLPCSVFLFGSNQAPCLLNTSSTFILQSTYRIVLIILS